MFKYLILLISTAYAQLSNIYFTANILENKLLLDNNVNITIDLIKPTDIIHYDTDKITCHNDIYNISYEMNYDLYKSEQNYLNVSLNITTINNFVIIFNGPFNYNGENIIEIKNYKIVFDYNSTNHNIERFGNYLYINFNNCNLNETIYNFIISYIL